MAAPATGAELTTSATPVDFLPHEILTDVLLRVPTPVALVRAAATSRIWRDAITTSGFLGSYRELHKSSPFLGLYVPRQLAGPPSFQMPDSFHSADDDARDLKDAALRAFNFSEIRRYQDHRLHDDFVLGRLPVHPDCRLLDCHNSRLLLTRGDEALEVRSPLARESILLPFPSDVVHPHCLEACLLQGRDKATASFRVVYLQHRREGRNRRQVRAFEYDSSRKSWQDHPWETLNSNIEGAPKEVMHAGHRIVCRYNGRSQVALMLDTRKMKFYVLPLPTYLNFAIGEIEDNVCCLVEAVGCADHRLRVWQLNDEKLDWELKKDIQMDQVLGEHVGYYRPRAISNGRALVCSTTMQHHFVVDLNTCTTKKFEFHGQSAYPMQMPWPPAFSDRIANAMNPGSSKDGNNENQHELRDGAAPLNYMPSNEPQYLDIQDPTTTAPTPAAVEHCFAKDKNYVPNDYLISDDVHIATLCSGEASAASRDAVSAGECKLLLGGSGSTFKFIDVGKQPIIDVSITSAPSLSDPSAGESAEQVAQDCACRNLGRDVCLDIQDSTATAPTSATAEQCFGKDKNYVLNNYLIPDLCGQFSDLVHPEAAGRFDQDGGPASVGDAKTGSGEFDAIEGLFGGTLAITPPATPPAEPEEPLVWRSRSPFCVQSLNHDLLFQPPALGRERAGSRESKGSPEAMGLGRRNWKRKPKYLEAIFALRRRHSFSIASKIPDDVHIATSCCGEASAASTAAGGFDRDGGPAFVGDAQTGSGELDAIEGLFGGTLATAQPAAPAVEPLSRVWIHARSLNHNLLLQSPAVDPEEPLSHVRIRTRSLNHDLLLLPPTLASCPQQGGKLDGSSPRGGKGNPEATMGRGRRQKMLNPKYLRGEWLLDND